MVTCSTVSEDNWERFWASSWTSSPPGEAGQIQNRAGVEGERRSGGVRVFTDLEVKKNLKLNSGEEKPEEGRCGPTFAVRPEPQQQVLDHLETHEGRPAPKPKNYSNGWRMWWRPDYRVKISFWCEMVSPTASNERSWFSRRLQVYFKIQVWHWMFQTDPGDTDLVQSLMSR